MTSILSEQGVVQHERELVWNVEHQLRATRWPTENGLTAEGEIRKDKAVNGFEPGFEPLGEEMPNSQVSTVSR